LKSGRQIGADWRDSDSPVNTIASSPDGKKIVSGSGDGAVRLWDIDTGKVIAKLAGHTDRVSSVCWNRDGRRMVSGSEDGTARVWDDGKIILGPIKTGLTNVKAVIYSPDMTMIATGGHSKKKQFIKIWDANTAKLIIHLKGHTLSVHCLAQTVDGKTLISGSYDGSIRTWNTTTWEQIAVFTEYTGSVYGIAISPNGRILASALSDRTVRLWDLEDGEPISLPLYHASAVTCVSFSTDGRILATGCKDKNAYTWNISKIVSKAGFADILLDFNVSQHEYLHSVQY